MQIFQNVVISEIEVQISRSRSHQEDTQTNINDSGPVLDTSRASLSAAAFASGSVRSVRCHFGDDGKHRPGPVGADRRASIIGVNLELAVTDMETGDMSPRWVET